MMPPDSIFPESLLLLDGSALAYRAHFAMAKSGLSNGAGLPTGATFGVAMEMERLLKRIHPRYAALVMDTKEPAFRHLKYPDYKATRDRMPDELAEQLPWIKDVARALGVPVLELPGFEADDLMGTLAKEADRQSIPVLLVTGDKDFFQLVTDRVLIYNVLKRDQEVLVLDPVGVREHFGVAPEQVVD
ncbi:MAG TPA: DNA polymerase I, partial [Planctomycetota bacterium]|nr:DNA polymerase I [Planctomycetota bacterium]